MVFEFGFPKVHCSPTGSDANLILSLESPKLRDKHTHRVIKTIFARYADLTKTDPAYAVAPAPHLKYRHTRRCIGFTRLLSL